MIKLKLGELLNSVEVLQKLASKELKAKPAWQTSRILKAAEKEIQEFNDTRMKLINKYGEKDEQGELITDDNGNCKIIADDTIEFSNQLNELINTEIEINSNKINIEDIENIDFTPAEMAQLENFIEFGE